MVGKSTAAPNAMSFLPRSPPTNTIPAHATARTRAPTTWRDPETGTSAAASNTAAPATATAASADAAAGGLIDGGDRCKVFIRDPEASCAVWDWARRDHVSSYFALHAPFEAAGVDSWWLDYCCDESRVRAAGLPPDT